MALAPFLARLKLKTPYLNHALQEVAMNATGGPDVQTRTRGRVNEPVPGAREAKLSFYSLLWILVAPIVGFLIAEAVDLGPAGDWELWKAATVGVLLMSPFAVGAYFGLRAVQKRCARGWVGLVGNLILAGLAIGMPMSEALTG